MAVGVEIATAYVSIVPSFRGIKNNLTKGIEAEAQAAGLTLEKTLAKSADKAAKNVSSNLEKGVTTAFRSKALQTAATALSGHLETAVSRLPVQYQMLGASVTSALSAFRTGATESEAFSARASAALGRVDGRVTELTSNVGTRLNNAFRGTHSTAMANLGAMAGKAALVTSAIVAMGAAVTVAGIAFSGLNRIGSIEKSTVAFEVMLGSAEKGKKVMSDLLDFAKTTPFDFPSIAEAATNLTAMGLSADRLIPTLKSLGNATSILGGGAQGLKEMSFVVGQIMSKSKLEGDELTQLGERGLAAAKIIGNQLGVKVVDVSKRLKDMGMSAQDAVDLLVKGIDKGTNGVNGHTVAMSGLMDKYKTTWPGILETFKAGWARMSEKLMTPLMPWLKGTVDDMTKFFGRIEKDGPAAMKALSDVVSRSGLGKAWTDFKKSLSDLGSALKPAVDAFKQLSPAIMEAIAWGLKKVTESASDFAKFLKENPTLARAVGIGLLIIVGALIAVFLAMTMVSLAAWVLVGAVLAAIGGIVLFFGKMGEEAGEAFVQIQDEWALLLQWLSSGWTMFQEWLSQQWEQIKTEWDLFTQWVSDGWSSTVDFLIELGDTLTAGLVSRIMDLVNQNASLLDVLKGIWDWAWKGIANNAISAVNGITGAINGVISAANSLLGLLNKLTGQNWSIPSIPSIPKFATGGIVTGPTLGLVGEAGDEAIMPLDKLQNFVDTHGGGGGGVQVVVLDPTGTDKAFVEMLRRMVRNEGRGNVQKAFGY